MAYEVKDRLYINIITYFITFILKKPAMKENLLQFIWKLQLLPLNNLISTSGQAIQIINLGIENLGEGPDFLQAKIEIENQLWAGNIEIHINSSDWYAHHHETDMNYDAVILHVVWEHDVQIFRKNNEIVATLELKNLISKELLQKFQQLFDKNKKWINCEKDIHTIQPFVFKNWLERLYFERLEEKSVLFDAILNKTKKDWEQTLFILLSKNFGSKINGASFLTMASSFNFSVLRKVSHNLVSIEALLLGQAGLLEVMHESNYFKELKKEHEYLCVKFKLNPINKGQVQFFRLRPPNFPTIRLSQLAVLYHIHQNVFSKFIEMSSVEEYYTFFEISTTEYWETHFTFDKESKKSKKKLTKSFVDLLLMNTIIPLKFMYLKSNGISDYGEIITLIEQLKPEQNSIIEHFGALKIKAENAFESQGLIQLKNEYCSKQRCLHCAVGKELLKN